MNYRNDHDGRSVVLFIIGYIMLFATLLGGGVFLFNMTGPIKNSTLMAGAIYVVFCSILFFVPLTIVLLSAISTPPHAKQ